MVGSSTVNSKNITIDRGYNRYDMGYTRYEYFACPSLVNKHNSFGGEVRNDRYDDISQLYPWSGFNQNTFHIKQNKVGYNDEHTIEVRRWDEGVGWDMNIRFKCCPEGRS